MPCPPHPNELRLTALGGTLPDLRKRFTRELQRLREMHRACARHQPLDDREDELRLIASTLERLGPESRKHRAWEYPGSPMNDGDPSSENLSRGGEETEWLKVAIAQCEVASCILGCALTRTVENDAEPKALLLHRKHRDHELSEALVVARREVKAHSAAASLEKRENLRIERARERILREAEDRLESADGALESALSALLSSRKSRSTSGLTSGSLQAARNRLEALERLRPRDSTRSGPVCSGELGGANPRATPLERQSA
jgi:hypothetical protein